MRVTAIASPAAIVLIGAAACTATLPTGAAGPDMSPAAIATTRPPRSDSTSTSSSPAGPAATQLTERTSEPLTADILPAGYTYVDSVDVDGPGPISNVYGGPDGPTGPTLYLYTGIGPEYVSSRQSDLAWDDLTGFSVPMHVSLARAVYDDIPWTFVDVDVDETSVHLVGRGTPEADVIATAERLLAGMPGAASTGT